MALSLILRNTCRLQAQIGVSQTFLWPSLKVVSTSRNFTQLTAVYNGNSKNSTTSILPKSFFMPSQRNMSGDHSKLWPIEKAVAVALIGIVPCTFIFPSFFFDNAFAIATVMHMHWGLEACAQDYVRPIIFGPIIPKLTLILIYVISAFTLGSLLYYNYTDIGIGRTVQKFWAIKE